MQAAHVLALWVPRVHSVVHGLCFIDPTKANDNWLGPPSKFPFSAKARTRATYMLKAIKSVLAARRAPPSPATHLPASPAPLPPVCSPASAAV